MSTESPVVSSAGARGVWLVAGILITVTTLAAGVQGVLSQWLLSRTETTRQVITGSIAGLTLKPGAGDVTVSPSTDGNTSVTIKRRWAFARPAADVDHEGDQLALSSGCSSWDNGCTVDFVIRVPSAAGVTATAGSGDLAITGLTGPVKVNIGSGDAHLARLSGPVEIKAGSGDVTAADLRSPTFVGRLGSGDMRLDFADPPASVYAKVGSGDVRIDVPRGPRYAVRLEAGSGDISSEVDEDSASAHQIEGTAGSGDLSVRYR